MCGFCFRFRNCRKNLNPVYNDIPLATHLANQMVDKERGSWYDVCIRMQSQCPDIIRGVFEAYLCPESLEVA